jgi:putative selenate reductase FAD-binding subunit
LEMNLPLVLPRESPYNQAMIQEILRPRTVSEAVRLKSSARAAYLGGGTWLNGFESDELTTLISLENLGLGTIETARGRCIIGATASLQQVVDAPAVPPALRAAASLTCSRTLRNMKTIGGELGRCAIDSASTYSADSASTYSADSASTYSADSALIPVLIALNADVVLSGKKKPYPIEQFCNERPADLILSISVPFLPCAIKAVSRTSHSPRSLVAAVSCRESLPVLTDVRVVVSDCRGQRVRLRDVEHALEGSALPAKSRIEEWVGVAFAPAADIHASSAYKRYLSGILVADALHGLASGKDAP